MRKANYKGYTVFEDGRVIGLRGWFLKPGLASNGYYTVCICTKEGNVSVPVHRLVAECFIPNPENKPWINHIDSDKTNNHASNLEWCTPQENAIHMAENSRMGRTIEAVRKRMSKPVINIVTGNIYSSCKKASIRYGINENTLRSKLCGFKKNNTNLKYLHEHLQEIQ